MRKIFYIVVNDEDSTGMNAISLVESPAVEHDFLCFSKEKQPVKMQFDDAKHIITGVVCLADTPIYRYSRLQDINHCFLSRQIHTAPHRF